MNRENDTDFPTILSIEDIDAFVRNIMKNEIITHQCKTCGKKYILSSYGHHIMECDECWFSRFPKEEVQKFCRSFFE